MAVKRPTAAAPEVDSGFTGVLKSETRKRVVGDKIHELVDVCGQKNVAGFWTVFSVFFVAFRPLGCSWGSGAASSGLFRSIWRVPGGSGPE